MAKFGINQRSFRYGILQKELWGRGDLPQYRDGLRDANNYLVNRQGALEPRKRLKRLVSSAGPIKLIPYLLGNNAQGLLALIASGDAANSTVQLRRIVPTTTAEPTNTIYQRSALEQIKFEQFGNDIILCHRDYSPQHIRIGTPLTIESVDLTGYAVRVINLRQFPILSPTHEAVYAVTPVNDLGIEGPQSRIRVQHTESILPPIFWDPTEGAVSYRVYRTAIGAIGEIGFGDPVGFFEEVAENKTFASSKNVTFAITPATIVNPFARGAIREITGVTSGRRLDFTARDRIEALRILPGNENSVAVPNGTTPGPFSNLAIVDYTIDRSTTPITHNLTVEANYPNNWSIYSLMFGTIKQGNDLVASLFTTDVPRNPKADGFLVDVPSDTTLRLPVSGLILGDRQASTVELLHQYAGEQGEPRSIRLNFVSKDERVPPTPPAPALSALTATNYAATAPTIGNSIRPLASALNLRFNSLSVGHDGALYSCAPAAAYRIVPNFASSGNSAVAKLFDVSLPEGYRNFGTFLSFAWPYANEIVYMFQGGTGARAVVYNGSTGAVIGTYDLTWPSNFPSATVRAFIGDYVYFYHPWSVDDDGPVARWRYKTTEGVEVLTIPNNLYYRPSRFSEHRYNWVTIDGVVALYSSPTNVTSSSMPGISYRLLSENDPPYEAAAVNTNALYWAGSASDGRIYIFPHDYNRFSSPGNAIFPPTSSFDIAITRPASWANATDSVTLEVRTRPNGGGTRLWQATGVTALSRTVSFTKFKLKPNTTFYVRGKVSRTGPAADSAWVETTLRTPA